MTTATKSLNNKNLDYLIQHYSLHTLNPIILNGIILPFIFLYLIAFYFWIYVYGVDEFYEGGIITIVAIVFIHILTCLCCYWSVHIRTFLNCKNVKTPGLGVLVKVVPTKNNGSPEIVPIQQTIMDEVGDKIDYWFIFQKTKYIWDYEKKTFRGLEFPINLTLKEYKNSRGLENDSDIKLATKKYGINKMEMGVPEFHELFIERATAPFFVFQIFSVGLWCLDEYWYYSLFTLCMLVVFECTLVQQQLRNMSEIRKMGNKPYLINVLRNNKWRQIESNQLLPGDVVSMIRSQNDNIVPCDMVLLRGSCIVDESMLTGESVPQMKESLDCLDDLSKELEPESEGKLFVLFGGTKVVQHTSPSKDGTIRAPDGGCVGYVLRNGFNTSQGKLLRTILFGVKRVTENNSETFAFILFLLIFAVAAASYVWVKGTEDLERNRYKLFLECTLILTSIIPPDLPIELSLAVNTSLLQLSKLYVYCTEPFRIPFAGKIQICCFDKTGTLTSDDLMVEGVVGLQSDEIISINQAPESTVHVLATCHSLAQLEDGLVGDPLEKATLTAIDWNLTKQDSVIPKKGKFKALKIYHRFYFSSTLKRMSVLAGYMMPFSNEVSYIGAVKGAPEIVQKMLKNVPNDYEKTYLEYSRKGARVLALGIKEFGKLDSSSVRDMKREDVEKDLDFAGFLIISCPLKPDSKNVIKELIHASHKVIMITGDNPLTACHVARELRFTKKSILIFTAINNEWKWLSINGEESFEMTNDTKKLLMEYDLCITGEGLQYLNQYHHSYLQKIIPYVIVCARFAPKQKEFMITALKHLGYYTLMCGDGTNDVGALKHANVGVSLLSKSPFKSKPKEPKDSSNVIQTLSSNLVSRNQTSDNNSNKKLTPRERAILRHNTQNTQNTQSSADALQKAMKDLEEEQIQIVKLGDASIAAPFTSRLSSITCVCHIIKQGRCTLVTTLQMFKILALNALISAYCQSVLYIDGVRFSDAQATLQGLFIAACFLFITRSKPLKSLSKEAPMPNIFNLYTITTILLQFSVHFTALLYLSFEAQELMPPREGKIKLAIDLLPHEKEEFKPNVLNSTVYIICLALQISTFAVNYKGHPFMESLRENRLLMYSMLVSCTVVVLLALGIVPELTSTFEIIEFPEDLRIKLLIVLFADTICAFIVDRVCSFLFGEIRKKSKILNY